jgi:cell wall-associated NlpC family hydrolase
MNRWLWNGLCAALAVLMAVSSVACASSGRAPRPFPFPAPVQESAGSPAREPPGSSRAIDNAALIATALELRGLPYRNGGSNAQGFDCSGFTQYVFARHGLALPREVRNQFRAGRVVAREDVAPGDLVFFSTTANGPTHVAIAVGGDQFVHAPSSTGVVRVERLTARYWAVRLIGVRRVAI